MRREQPVLIGMGVRTGLSLLMAASIVACGSSDNGSNSSGQVGGTGPSIGGTSSGIHTGGSKASGGSSTLNTSTGGAAGATSSGQAAGGGGAGASTSGSVGGASSAIGGASSGAGGTSAATVGGTSAATVGGTSALAAGGSFTQSTGGQTSTLSGGSSTLGTNTGGNSAAGGATGNVGGASTGGASSVGGALTTGGSLATGGMTNAGTATEAGGASTVGGNVATGGVSTTGGTAAAGGTTSTTTSVCTMDAECTPGQICGAVTAGVCGGCTSDNQCQTDSTYGVNTICNTTTTLCVSAACTTAGQACANPADVCCPATSGNLCVAGDCCSNTDCSSNPKGGICGAGGTNLCGKCTLDSQCPAGDVCNTTTGQCVVDSSTLCAATPPGSAGGQPVACSANSADMCCTTTAACVPNTGTDACCPGAAGNTYCQTKLSDASAVCSGNVCTACAPVSGSNPTYVVDPVNGSDVSGTGSAQLANSAASDACALRTITRALQLIGSNTTLATSIVVVGGTGVTINAGEKFPIPIPSNVTVTTKTGPVTVQVPDATSGFRMAASASSITSGSGAPLTITTTVVANSGTTAPTGGNYGIQVATGAAATISNLTIQGMLSDGVRVSGGTLTLGEGVVSTGNGIQTSVRTGYTADGIHVTGTGSVVATLASGSPVHFDANSAHGIFVDTTGYVDLTGAVANAQTGTGTITANGNALAGVWIQQTPGTSLPKNVLNGLVAYANTGGNGLRLVAGSNVQVRNCAFLGNQSHGVNISTNAAAGNNDISLIDLGSSTSPGNNTFQAALGSGNNGAAGICLSVGPQSGQLKAEGNKFHAATCTAGNPTLTLNPGSCANNATQCAGGVCDLGFNSNADAQGNSFDVATCTQ